jgi:hypothetical protein
MLTSLLGRLTAGGASAGGGASSGAGVGATSVVVLDVPTAAAVCQLAALMLPQLSTIAEHLAVTGPLTRVVAAAQPKATLLANAVGEVVQAFAKCTDLSISSNPHAVEQLCRIISASTPHVSGPDDWLQCSEMCRSYKQFLTSTSMPINSVYPMIEKGLVPALRVVLERYIEATEAAADSNSRGVELVPQLQARVVLLAEAYGARVKRTQKRTMAAVASSAAAAKRARTDNGAAAAAAAVQAAVVCGTDGTDALPSFAAAIQQLRHGLHMLTQVQTGVPAAAGGGSNVLSLPPAIAAELAQIVAELGRCTNTHM